MKLLLLSILLLLGSFPLFAAKLVLPTANQSIYKINEQNKYFAGTVGRTWESGTFGCVRSGGGQMHEGIDIRSIRRDKNGEPIDPILATADGTVAYINPKASLSNYGIYIILRHRIDGLEIYSNYAHLSAIRPGLKVGQSVKAGDVIGTMGRTANTRETISKDRAHLHFELNFFVNEQFPAWYKKNFPGQRNDHGIWNGQNLIGVDPRLIYLTQKRQGDQFSLLRWVQSQPELCRVLVRRVDFPWARRYAPLVQRNPVAEKNGVAGYEIALSYNGLPIQLTPRSAADFRGHAAFYLLSVNVVEQKKNPCRKLVAPKGKGWELTSSGQKLLELLTY